MLCMVALVAMMAGGALAFSYPIMNQSEDTVYFEYECRSNSDCTGPATEYCGENQVYSLKCIPTDTCDVVCRPLNPKRADESWSTGAVNVGPAVKIINNPVKITTKDSRNQKPLVYNIEIYYGGKVAGSLTIVSIYKESVYEGGTFVTSGHTDRQGVFTFTPDKPGQYVVMTMGTYVRFTVADASGRSFNCSNGVCETALGEDANVCSADCNAGSSGNAGGTGSSGGSNAGNGSTGTIAPPPLYCGDSICNNGETQTSCPQDCGTPSTGGGTGGANTGGNAGGANTNGNAGTGQGQNTTGGTAQPQGGGDNTMMIIIIIAIIAVGALIAFFIINEGKKPKAPKADKPAAPIAAAPAPVAMAPAPVAAAPAPKAEKPKGTPKQPGKCKKCGMQLVAGSAFCVSCGEKV